MSGTPNRDFITSHMGSNAILRDEQHPSLSNEPLRAKHIRFPGEKSGRDPVCLAEIWGYQIRSHGRMRPGLHVLFTFSGLMIQMSVPFPDRTDKAILRSPSGRVRSIEQQRVAYEQEVRARWRALMLAIKAKLVSVESGVSTVEKEFMAWVVMPDGKTVGDHLIPHLNDAVKRGKMPQQFLALTQ